jgi:transmembrane sensor
MHPNNIQILIEKYFAGTITPEEQGFLDEWYQKQSNKKVDWIFENLDNEDRLRERIFANIEDALQVKNYNKTRQNSWYRIAVAASILVTLGVGSYFWYQAKNVQPAAVAKVIKNYTNDITPGGNKALLTLADGSKISLDDSGNGVVVQQGSVIINKETNGKLVYNNPENIAEKNSINILQTPRGGQYQLVLTDGTKIWLNSESSLKYPSQFTGPVRVVELTGEAYFEVAKNAKVPFQVKVNNMLVDVLGTHFNVKAYQDEASINTTLLEGSVKVIKGNNTRYITPGQQVSINNNSESFSIRNADIDEVMSWQRGYYVFKSRTIKSIMQEISRWYDVEIVYQGDTNDLTFSGKISRFKNISEVLGLLELTGDIHFKLEGRRVTVMP